MSKPSATDILDMIEPACARALAEGRWHDAIVPAMLAYTVLHENAGPDQLLELAPLTIVQSAIKGMHGDIEKADKLRATGTDEPTCSFCGLGQSKVRLATGPNVFICEPCVGTLSEVFATPAKS